MKWDVKGDALKKLSCRIGDVKGDALKKLSCRIGPGQMKRGPCLSNKGVKSQLNRLRPS